MYFKNTVEYLSISKYKIVLRLKESVTFFGYKGMAFRSGFSRVFKKVSCIAKKKICDTCDFKASCVYSLLFEAKVSKKEYRRLGFTEPPRPFVLEPLADEKNVYQPYENFEFYILIFGNSIHFLPYLVLTFNELGKKGFGETKAKCELVTVETIDGKPIYDVQTQTFYNYDSTIKLSFEEIKEVNEIKIRFISPTRIKTENDKKEISFQTLISSLLRRFSGLLAFYTNKNVDWDYDEIVKEAGKVSIKFSGLKYVEVERYLTQQNKVVKLYGLVGETIYQGEITKFYPLLKIGEFIHVGKNTTFGLGKYEIVL
jgi:CRISPR-associated endoribonuclease Cas6